jgi:hypothetical protein
MCDVLGTHLSIRRATDFLDKDGVLPDADWEALASLGPALNVTVEQLRNHVSRILDSFDPDLPVQDRATKLCAAVEGKQLGETLSLLVVAEDSLYRWQLLRLARVGDSRAPGSGVSLSGVSPETLRVSLCRESRCGGNVLLWFVVVIE